MLMECSIQEEVSQQSPPGHLEVPVGGVTECFWITLTHPVLDPMTVRGTVRTQKLSLHLVPGFPASTILMFGADQFPLKEWDVPRAGSVVALDLLGTCSQSLNPTLT